MTPESEESKKLQFDLWKSVQGGNHQAFRIFYMKFTDVLYNYGKRICHNEEIIKDSIQDVFQGIWEKKENIQINSSIKQYLMTAFRHDLIYKIKKEQKSGTELQSSNFELSVESTIIDSEDRMSKNVQLNDALLKLTNRQKEIVFLKYYENLSYDEISSIMDLNKNSLYKLLSGAIQRLKDYMIVLLLTFLY
ncbi:MAG: sigma-70 family RNA polymerase sigma factor [Cyclobacteriaceae bacterium]|nr:sigma-70 family RNA polymerase sigma factor [Cyclobacteriaceae bacterium]